MWKKCTGIVQKSQRKNGPVALFVPSGQLWYDKGTSRRMMAGRLL